MANDCPEPEKCRRCRQEGHKVDECPEPEKCFNCREEGHKVSHKSDWGTMVCNEN